MRSKFLILDKQELTRTFIETPVPRNTSYGRKVKARAILIKGDSPADSWGEDSDERSGPRPTVTSPRKRRVNFENCRNSVASLNSSLECNPNPTNTPSNVKPSGQGWMSARLKLPSKLLSRRKRKQLWGQFPQQSNINGAMSPNSLTITVQGRPNSKTILGPDHPNSKFVSGQSNPQRETN